MRAGVHDAVANTYNSVMYVRNVFSDAWDKLDYPVSCLDIYNGALIAGDPISNNVYTLFSGFDDDGSVTITTGRMGSSTSAPIT